MTWWKCTIIRQFVFNCWTTCSNLIAIWMWLRCGVSAVAGSAAKICAKLMMPPGWVWEENRSACTCCACAPFRLNTWLINVIIRLSPLWKLLQFIHFCCFFSSFVFPVGCAALVGAVATFELPITRFAAFSRAKNTEKKSMRQCVDEWWRAPLKRLIIIHSELIAHTDHSSYIIIYIQPIWIGEPQENPALKKKPLKFGSAKCTFAQFHSELLEMRKRILSSVFVR